MKHTLTISSGVVRVGDVVSIAVYADQQELWRVVKSFGGTVEIERVRWWHRFWWANKRQWRLLIGLD